MVVGTDNIVIKKNTESNKKESSRMQGGSQTDFRVLNWSNGAQDVDPYYLRLHHNMMQVN